MSDKSSVTHHTPPRPRFTSPSPESSQLEQHGRTGIRAPSHTCRASCEDDVLRLRWTNLQMWECCHLSEHRRGPCSWDGCGCQSVITWRKLWTRVISVHLSALHDFSGQCRWADLHMRLLYIVKSAPKGYSATVDPWISGWGYHLLWTTTSGRR